MFADGQGGLAARGGGNDELDPLSARQSGGQQRVFAADALVGEGRDLSCETVEHIPSQGRSRVMLHLAAEGFGPEFAGTIDVDVRDVGPREDVGEGSQVAVEVDLPLGGGRGHRGVPDENSRSLATKTETRAPAATFKVGLIALAAGEAPRFCVAPGRATTTEDSPPRLRPAALAPRFSVV
jgi:hypothetical protein